MSEASEWERWKALVTPILEASPSLSEPEIGGLTEQIVDDIIQQTRADLERLAQLMTLDEHKTMTIARAHALLRSYDAGLGLEGGIHYLKLRGDQMETELAELKDWWRSAWALLTAAASSGVEHEDSRLDYLTVQIDRGGSICTCYSRQVWTGVASVFWWITVVVMTEHAILTRARRRRDSLESAQKTINTLEKELGIGERERER